jgi:N-methylhydantoinase A
MSYKVGIDIGGTFTDIVVSDFKDVVEYCKVLSNKENPGKAILDGLKLCAEDLDIEFNEFIKNTSTIIHGATIGTNAVLSKDGPKTGLICTKNFRDVLLLRDGYKPNRWNLKMDPFEPFIPRYLTFPVEERINCDGEIVVELNKKDVRKAGYFFRKNNVIAAGCCLIWSVANPKHEIEIKKIFEKEFKDIIISISTDIMPVMREWQRTCTVAVNAFLIPIISSYLDSILKMLSEIDFKGNLLLVQSNGGITSIKNAKFRPVNLLMSGPSVGPTAGNYYLKMKNINNAIIVDMGGTSFDVSVINNGSFKTTKELRINDIPLSVQAINVKSIGAGGGSIAWIDKGGALHVGPQSAGSNPGPACYMRGGNKPTVTDANLVLGYINPDFFLGGRMSINPKLSYEAIKDNIANKLKISIEEAALGINKVVNNNMTGAIRAILTEQGIGPQDYYLVVGGGAGAIHASYIAKEIGIKRIIIPRSASELCAFGLVTTDIKHNYVRNYTNFTSDVRCEDLERIYQELEAIAINEFKEINGENKKIYFIRQADLKYPYQINELTLDIPFVEIKEEHIVKIIEEFHNLHEKIFTYSIRDSVCQFVALRLTAIQKAVEMKPISYELTNKNSKVAIKNFRKIILDEFEGSIPVYDNGLLKPGMKVNGPAIIEEISTTILILPNSKLIIDPWKNYEILIDSEFC